jgi:capsular exopolysaccharide synthesis family protein
VDGDLRNPSIAEYTGLDGTVGLTSVLLGNASLHEAVQPWGVPGLDVLVAGAVPPNPNQLLASDTMRSTLEVLKERYDFVVIDTSPIIPVTDPLWLVHETDGAIVVVRERRTKRQQLHKALSTLDSVGARVLGVVANDVRHHERTTYYTDDENARPRQSAAAFRSRVKKTSPGQGSEEPTTTPADR